MASNDFLEMIDAAIQYFNPDAKENESARKLLELANETHKIEIDRLQRSIDETLSKIKSIELENSTLIGNLAFTTHELSVLEKDNLAKIDKSRYLTDLLESRKVVLSEAYAELTTHRRKETNKEIAQRRLTVKVQTPSKLSKAQSMSSIRPKSSIESNSAVFKKQVDDIEETLENAVIKMKKVDEEIKRKDEIIGGLKFRLGIEANEQKRLNVQHKKLSEEQNKALEIVVPVLKRPSTGVIRTKTVIR